MQTGKIRKLVFAIAAAFGLSATGAENVTGQLPEMSPEFQNLKWETGRFGKLETRDGRQILSVTQAWRSQTLAAIRARYAQARRYGMAYVAATNRGKYKGFQKESTEYGFLGNLGLV